MSALRLFRSVPANPVEWGSFFQTTALPLIYFGYASPDISAPPGSLYLNLNGGAGVTLWVKESGTGASGWVAK